MSLLNINDLSVRYPGIADPVVDAVSLSIGAGESVGLVGESGSGKTQTALAIMGLSGANARIAGSVTFADEELVGADAKALRRIRATRIAMIFQDPSQALNPYRRIGDQLRYILESHRLASGKAARAKVLEMLERTGLPDPSRQAKAYPHQLSGGMRQRALIASALIAEPDVLIADEPTTALDATVQAQILELLRDLRREAGVALFLITHDLGVIAQVSEHLLVMDSGRIVEAGTTKDVFAAPRHERTQELLAAARDTAPHAPDMKSEERRPVLEVEGLSISYKDLVAVEPVNLDVRPGETLAIVGESGSGKTSLVRGILGLTPAREGAVRFIGRELAADLKGRQGPERRQLTLVFQDPVRSLDPAIRIHRSIAEPLRVHQPELDAAERDAMVVRMMQRVGLDESLGRRFPHQLSGGQAQRVAIARALILKPQVLICDEAVASLDSSVRRGILELLAEEQRRTALSIIFIAHDLNVVRQISHRVLVMYMGRVFEVAASDALFAKPRHPYTRALIDSVPRPEPDAPGITPVQGEVSSMLDPPTGCVFHPRCRFAVDRCREARPELRFIEQSEAACHRAFELDLG